MGRRRAGHKETKCGGLESERDTVIRCGASLLILHSAGYSFLPAFKDFSFFSRVILQTRKVRAYRGTHSHVHLHQRKKSKSRRRICTRTETTALGAKMEWNVTMGAILIKTKPVHGKMCFDWHVLLTAHTFPPLVDASDCPSSAPRCCFCAAGTYSAARSTHGRRSLIHD